MISRISFGTNLTFAPGLQSKLQMELNAAYAGVEEAKKDLAANGTDDKLELSEKRVWIPGTKPAREVSFVTQDTTLVDELNRISQNPPQGTNGAEAVRQCINNFYATIKPYNPND